METHAPVFYLPWFFKYLIYASHVNEIFELNELQKISTKIMWKLIVWQMLLTIVFLVLEFDFELTDFPNEAFFFISSWYSIYGVEAPNLICQIDFGMVILSIPQS